MFRYLDCLALMPVILVWLEVILVLREENVALGMLISKSDLTICDSVGLNPHNVVDNKSCQKKLIIAQAVRSGQVRNGREAVNASVITATVFLCFSLTTSKTA